VHSWTPAARIEFERICANKMESSMVGVKKWILSMGMLLIATMAPVAHGQWAVIDVGAIAQLIQQVQTMREQLATAQNHFQQAQAEFQSMTGERGMERLLGNTVRNYLPADWTQLSGTLQNASSAYAALASSLHGAVDANAVLSAEQLSLLPEPERQQLQSERRSTALLQVMARDALATTSARFASIQLLIDAIPSAVDQKGILDLQARIGAEEGMLQNEQTKLQVLYEVAQGERWADEQRAREQAIAGHGRFETRFQPTP
jgi:type IV secretion system protein VirB5